MTLTYREVQHRLVNRRHAGLNDEENEEMHKAIDDHFDSEEKRRKPRALARAQTKRPTPKKEEKPSLPPTGHLTDIFGKKDTAHEAHRNPAAGPAPRTRRGSEGTSKHS